MAKQRRKHSKGPEPAAASTPLTIPESEQWRIIRDSGILDKDTIGAPSSNSLGTAAGPSDQADEIFNAALLIIPFTFLYVMMDILIHQQYGKHPALREYAGRAGSAFPALTFFIFYTNRHKKRQITQIGLFLVSLAVGTRLIWLVNLAPWHVIIRQGPPLATLWIFTIAILDLLPAVISLLLVAVWVWWSNLKLVL